MGPVALVTGAAMLGAFVAHGLTTPRTPLLDPRLFARPPFGVAALSLLLLGMSVFGTTFLLPLYLQGGRGLSAWGTGLLLAPQGVGAALGSVLVSRLVDRASARTLVLTGLALVTVGTVAFTRLGHVPDAVLTGSLLLRGFGAALIGTPVLALVYRRVGQDLVARASGALNLLNTVGGSVGTAVVSVVLAARFAERGAQAPAAYADTFWWVLGFCLLAAAAATRLPATRPGH